VLLRERIRRGDELLGVFLQVGSPVIAEIAGSAGFDWVLVDLEHGAGSEAELLHQLQALAITGTASIVRAESATRLRIGRALDLGAAGVMVPQVNDVQTAKTVTSWLRYPPEGVRGVALSARGAGYGTAGHGDIGRLNESVVSMLQIETNHAVDVVDDIASVDGVDVLFVGPSDLSHSLGVPGNFDAPAFTDALQRISDAAQRHDRALGVHIPNVAELERYRALGFSVISIAGDGTTLSSSFRQLLGTARENARPVSGV
jgi:4-hydroxy-2-oxoheptanedioate aldolase